MLSTFFFTASLIALALVGHYFDDYFDVWTFATASIPLWLTVLGVFIFVLTLLRAFAFAPARSDAEGSLENLSANSPVEKLNGIGKSRSKRLRQREITTVGKVAEYAHTSKGRATLKEIGIPEHIVTSLKHQTTAYTPKEKHAETSLSKHAPFSPFRMLIQRLRNLGKKDSALSHIYSKKLQQFSSELGRLDTQTPEMAQLQSLGHQFAWLKANINTCKRSLKKESEEELTKLASKLAKKQAQKLHPLLRSLVDALSNNYAIIAGITTFILTVVAYTYVTALYRNFGVSVPQAVGSLQEIVSLGISRGAIPVVSILLVLALAISRLLRRARELDGEHSPEYYYDVGVEKFTRTIESFDSVKGVLATAIMMANVICAALLIDNWLTHYHSQEVTFVHEQNAGTLWRAKALGASSDRFVLFDVHPTSVESCEGALHSRDESAPEASIRKSVNGAVWLPMKNNVTCLFSSKRLTNVCARRKVEAVPEERSAQVFNVSFHEETRENPLSSGTKDNGISWQAFAKYQLHCDAVGDVALRSPEFVTGQPSIGASAHTYPLASTLSVEALRRDFREFAADVHSQAYGKRVALHVVGFASSKGRPSVNANLSDRRAAWYTRHVATLPNRLGTRAIPDEFEDHEFANLFIRNSSRGELSRLDLEDTQSVRAPANELKTAGISNKVVVVIPCYAPRTLTANSE